jgi:hypothetical protein
LKEAFQKGGNTLDALFDGIPDDGLLSHPRVFSCRWA